MGIEDLLAIYNEDQRKEIVFPGTRREAGVGVVRLVAEEPDGRGMVLFSALDEATADAAIEGEIAYFGGLGQPFEWKLFSFDRPADLKERLAVRGFEVGEEEAVVVLDAARAPAMLLEPVRHDVRRVMSPRGLDDVLAIEEAVWGESFEDLRSYLEASMEGEPAPMSIYVAYVEGTPASAAWVYFAEGSQFASLWGGSTRAEYREQGLYTALLAVRLQEALSRGARYLTTDASPDSRPILEKLGFELIGFTWECVWGEKIGD